LDATPLTAMCSVWDSAPTAHGLRLGMVLFPQMAPRRNLSCPQCASPHAFITFEQGHDSQP